MFRAQIFIACAATTLLATSHAALADDLDAIINDYWANELAEDPFRATTADVDDYNDRVPDVAPADHARRAGGARAFLDRLSSLDRGSLSEDGRINADLLSFILKHDVALAEYRAWRMPFLADTGFHTNFQYTLNSTPFRNYKDYDNYLARLRAFPAYIDQQIENMRLGVEEGFTQPKEIVPLILPSFEAQVKERAEDHPYYAPFEKMPSTISDRRKKRLREEARAVMVNEVIPAFSRLSTYMREDYLPNARETLGISETPNGEAYYEALVRFFTTLDDASADEIHQTGLREVARIRAEMHEVMADAGFDGSFEEFLEFLRTDRQFYAEDPQGLLERAAWIAKDIDGRLPAYFGKLPRQPYSVEPVPDDIAPNYTNARYVGASLEASRGGQFWVNTYKHEIRPLYQLPAMALHEGVPGHHLQSALSLEMENVPEFRNEFYPHAFGEGWGLYSEKLGVEMGVYGTPYEHFGRLTWEMWRACRLVIDTGIHAKGWTRQEAMDYLASNTALSLHNVQTEIDRYIAWPGQALAYKVGELTIWELRRKAEAELGDGFDIRAFHDAVLAEGGLPLEMLRQQIDDYIADAKRK
ncbi:MAG: DUF885 domain-containing protein [Pseudomonadota bacterium]